jgi:hypothetical protein
LRAFVGALAPDAAGADRDQGLANLIAGAAGIGVRVDEGVDAGLLVGLEVLAGFPGDASDEDESEQDDGDLFEADAAEEEAADQDGQVGEGGA